MNSLLNKILVAISGSDTSINAAKYGIMLAKSLKLELNVIYVVDTSTIQDLLLSKIFIQEESAEYENNL
ncbi:MAG: universal stress protein, partial [Spirochaetales bacterium]|nr:universal stress protein [Spirochaetales bacterium]